MAIKKTKGDLLDVMSLQEQIDQVVFDYFDTSVRHEIAHEQLMKLFTEVRTYFTDYLAKNDGVLPAASTYWHMFVSCASQLSYFLAITTLTTAKQPQDTALALEYATLAVQTLPHLKTEDDELMVEEMKQQFTVLIEDKDKKEQLVGALTNERNDVGASMRLLADYMAQHTVI